MRVPAGPSGVRSKTFSLEERRQLEHARIMRASDKNSASNLPQDDAGYNSKVRAPQALAISHVPHLYFTVNWIILAQYW